MRRVVRTTDFPIVRTKKGLLHGFEDNGVFQFYGVRYGRAERFELPRETEAWDGVKDAKAYGYICPLMDEGMDAQAGVKHDPNADTNPFAVPFSSFEMAHRYWVMDEDCLFLNVWTKHIPGAVENETVPDGDWNRPVKRPVLLWLHGGGYGAGSAIEIPAYDGHNLSEFGDVVVVSINHRLNCIGFLDLSSFGEEFQYSGIAGMADIVLALGWIRDNIGAFGGDPDNITVAGQSGGGGKATNLLQMPPADGLYHKVISQSGAFRDRPDMSVATEKRRWQLLGQKTVEYLGLDSNTVSQIRTVSYERLSKAAEQAGKELGYPEGLMLFEPSPTEGWFTGYYNSSGFRPESAHIPVIAGTVGGEFNFMHYLGDKSKYSGDEVKKLLLDCYGEDTERILELFRAAYPGLHDLYALSMDTTFRPGTVAYLDARSAYTDAPCYNYQMNFVIPYLGGILPWHCACIPFMFRNVEMEPAHCTAADTYAEKVQDEVSRAWIRFMETGDPSTEDLPWDRYSPSRRCRMIFSERTGMTDTSDDELMDLVGRHIPVFL